jgi:hypothetical protein
MANTTSVPNTTARIVKELEPKSLFVNRYPPVEKIQFDPMRVSTSRDPDIAPLLQRTRKPVLEGSVQGNVDKSFVPSELSEFRDILHNRAGASLKVEKHRHPGTMFTLVVDGSLRINGIELTSGDWYIVPPGNEYEIESLNGYRAVACYNNSC